MTDETIAVRVYVDDDVVNATSPGNVVTHTHVATDISDSAEAGRGILTAARTLDLRDLTAPGMSYLTDHGAIGDGSTEDTSAINSWLTKSGLLFAAYGNYSAAGSVDAFTRPRLILADNAKESGTELPFITVSDATVGFKSIPKNYVYVRQSTAYRTDSVTMRVDRISTTDDGITNPKALRVYTVKNHSNTQTEWAISGEIDSYSNTASSGETATSGVANKYGTASVFGGHFQANDFNIFAADTDVTPIIGAELNIQAVGLDHPSANNGYGNRRVLDVIARTNESVTDWDTAGGNDGDAEIGAGIVIRSDTLTDGYFRYGAVITDAGAVGKISTALYIDTDGGRSIYITGNVTGTHFQISGNAALGLVLSGTYSSLAMRVESGQYIGMENTNTIKTAYGVSSNIWGFYSGANERVGFNMTASPGVRVAGVQIIGARDTGWAAMTGSTNKATVYDTSTVTLAQLAGRVMAMQAALTAHGIIGA
jgi:hypothetical protein